VAGQVLSLIEGQVLSLIKAAIGIRSARMIGSRPCTVGGRNSNASWMSGAKWSKFMI
jgi:hypothetical protein